jgi:hypothetical protein
LNAASAAMNFPVARSIATGIPAARSALRLLRYVAPRRRRRRRRARAAPTAMNSTVSGSSGMVTSIARSLEQHDERVRSLRVDDQVGAAGHRQTPCRTIILPVASARRRPPSTR